MSVRNGRITGVSAIVASNVGGVCEIVSCSDGTATDARARKVMLRFVNSVAWVAATGASAAL